MNILRVCFVAGVPTRRNSVKVQDNVAHAFVSGEDTNHGADSLT